MIIALQTLHALGSVAAIYLAGTYAVHAYKAHRARKRAKEIVQQLNETLGQLVTSASECDCERCTAERAEQQARAN